MHAVKRAQESGTNSPLQIGNGRGRGVFFHTALAIRADVNHQVPGVFHQKTRVRPEGPSKRSRLTPAGFGEPGVIPARIDYGTVRFDCNTVSPLSVDSNNPQIGFRCCAD